MNTETPLPTTETLDVSATADTMETHKYQADLAMYKAWDAACGYTLISEKEKKFSDDFDSALEEYFQERLAIFNPPKDAADRCLNVLRAKLDDCEAALEKAEAELKDKTAAYEALLTTHVAVMKGKAGMATAAPDPDKLKPLSENGEKIWNFLWDSGYAHTVPEIAAATRTWFRS